MTTLSVRLNRLLILLFGAGLAIQLIYVLVGFASMPSYYQRIIAGTIEPAQIGPVLLSSASVAQMAANRGLSPGQYAAYRILVSAAAVLLPLAVAALVAWRARRQWFAWFTAFIILFLSVAALAEPILVSRFMPATVLGLNDIFWFLLLLYLFLFPNGTAVPRRAAWPVGGLVLYHFIVQAGTVVAYVAPDFAARTHLPNWGDGRYVAPVLLNFVLILACQVYRYRRVSTPTERQQTRWFLLGLGVIVAFFIPVSMVQSIAGQDGYLTDTISFALWLPLTFSLAVAILRYRLWDIDVIIRKTLVYGVLSALLGLVYFGLVLLLQTVFDQISRQQSPISIVISTLVIAALFSPLRRRVQSFIDRRFFRQKYDAQQVLARFALTARDEVSLAALTAELSSVMQETLQPTKVALWLRKEK